MSASDEEEIISQIIGITGLDPIEHRDIVRAAYKSHSGSGDSVINEYYNNEDPTSFITKYSSGWDESLFSGDREGNRDEMASSMHVEAPSDNLVIHGVEPPPYAEAVVGAPSRPPSRTNDRSPIGKLADWSAANAGVTDARDENDDDLQRALRMSAEEEQARQNAQPQESGIVDVPSTSEPHFGPANREHYDTANWSMVPTGPSAVPSAGPTPLPAPGVPRPSLRKRPEGVPVLITGCPVVGNGPNRLGGLLTILHNIPLGRNLLLQTNTPPPTYGYNSQWWNGQTIDAPPKAEGEESPSPLDAPPPSYFEHELHRLMAFMDLSERSYGSASVISEAISCVFHNAERSFYEILSARNPNEAQPLLTTAAATSVSGDAAGQEDDDDDNAQEFGLIDLPHSRADYDRTRTLYEVIDHIMWMDMAGNGGVAPSEARMAVFRDMGDVLVVNMGGDGPTDRIEIPEELYPERWLESRRTEALRIQKALRADLVAAEEAAKRKASLYHFTDPDTGHEGVDSRDIAVRSGRMLGNTLPGYLASRAKFRALKESGFDTETYADDREPPYALDEEEERLSRVLKGASEFARAAQDQAASKMKQIDSQLERIEARRRLLGRLLTDPNKKGLPKPFQCKKYLLRGVTTTADVTYVPRQSEDLMEFDDAPKEPGKWWRLEFTPEDQGSSVRAQKLSFDEVANRIWAETKTPVLVYATEHALNVEKMPLGSSLERFVKADNKSFRSELQQESSTTETSMEVDAEGETNDEFFAPSDMLRSPPKRKHRSDSVDSMASNRASMGSRDGSDDAGQEAASVLQSISVADGAGAAQAHDPFTGLKGDMDRMRVAAEQAAAQAQKFATAQQVDSVPPPAYEPPPLPERRAADAGEKSGYGAAPGPEMQEKQSTSVLQRLPSQGEGKGLDMDMADD